MADSKKKFLFMSVPLQGHLNPLLAPAKLLLEQGHCVRLACYEEMRAKIEGAGIPFVSLGPDQLQLDQHGEACLDPFKSEEERSAAGVKMFLGWEIEMYPRLLQAIADSATKPDIIVADIATMAAFNIAEQLRLPLALLGSLPLGMCLANHGLESYNAARHIPHQSFGGKVFSSRMSLFEKYWSNPRAKRTEQQLMQQVVDARMHARCQLGLPAMPDFRAPMQLHPAVPRHTVLLATSWVMEAKRELPPNWHLTGAMGVDFSVNYPHLEAGPIREFLDQGAAAGQPAVLVALGTIVVPKEQQVQQMAAAFASMHHVRFVWSLKETCQAMLPAGYAPANVLVSSWVPQPGVLAHPAVKAFVSHGGQNSTNEGLTAGKPILCMPFGADQPVNAQLIADRGYGLKADPTKLTSKKLVAAINNLLSKPQYAAAAAAASRELRSRSGPKEAAQLLVQFAAAEHVTAAAQPPAQLTLGGAEPAAVEEVVSSGLRSFSRSVSSAGPQQLRVVDSATEVLASAGDTAAAKDKAGAAAAAPGKGLLLQQQQFAVAAQAAAV